MKHCHGDFMTYAFYSKFLNLIVFYFDPTLITL